MTYILLQGSQVAHIPNLYNIIIPAIFKVPTCLGCAPSVAAAVQLLLSLITRCALLNAATAAGKYVVAMDSDGFCFGGQGRIHWDAEHFTTPAEDGKFNDRDQYFQVRLWGKLERLRCFMLDKLLLLLRTDINYCW